MLQHTYIQWHMFPTQVLIGLKISFLTAFVQLMKNINSELVGCRDVRPAPPRGKRAAPPRPAPQKLANPAGRGGAGQS